MTDTQLLDGIESAARKQTHAFGHLACGFSVDAGDVTCGPLSQDYPHATLRGAMEHFLACNPGQVMPLFDLFSALTCHGDANRNQILTVLERIEKKVDKLMAGISDVTSAQTTLHADLVAENGLIKQLLTAFANGNLTSAQAQALVDQMTSDDSDAKSSIAAITAALPPTT